VGETYMHGISWRALPITALPGNNTLLQKSLLLRTYSRACGISDLTNPKNSLSQTTSNGQEKIIFLASVLFLKQRFPYQCKVKETCLHFAIFSWSDFCYVTILARNALRFQNLIYFFFI